MSERARRANSTHLILTVRGAAGTPAALFGKRNNGMSVVREDWQYPGTLPQKYKWICFCKPLVTISLPVLRGLSCQPRPIYSFIEPFVKWAPAQMLGPCSPPATLRQGPSGSMALRGALEPDPLGVMVLVPHWPEFPALSLAAQSVKVPIARICKYLKITYTVGGRYLGGHGHGPGERWSAQSTGRAEQLRRAGTRARGATQLPRHNPALDTDRHRRSR